MHLEITSQRPLRYSFDTGKSKDLTIYSVYIYIYIYIYIHIHIYTHTHTHTYS